jgi:hypothetical protein
MTGMNVVGIYSRLGKNVSASSSKIGKGNEKAVAFIAIY